LFKTVKLGQLQMGLESRNQQIIPFFFHLKNSDTIAEQKKTYGRFPPGAIVTMTTWLQGMLVPKGSKP
jgi:hypothetical protein